MCNGFSTRASQGGSIAVLRPIHADMDSVSGEECRLLFNNDAESRSDLGTQVEFTGFEKIGRTRRGGYWVVIHRDGDLSSSNSFLIQSRLPTNPFFSFSLDGPTSATQLSRRLDLGVGDTGIIGRKVSVMTSSTKGPLTVAEGIIGWN